MADPEPRRLPLYQTEFGPATDDAAGRTALALVLTVLAVGCAYVVRSAQTWTFFCLGALATGVASGWVAVQFFMACSAAKHAMRALPSGWPDRLPVSRRVEIVLAKLIVAAPTPSVAIPASKGRENVDQLTFLWGRQ